MPKVTTSKPANTTLKVVGNEEAVPTVAWPPASNRHDFVIQDDVALPAKAAKAQRSPRYFPLAELKVGQSFFVARDKKAGLKPAVKAYYAANPSEKGTIVLDAQGSGRETAYRVFKREAPVKKAK